MKQYQRQERMCVACKARHNKADFVQVVYYHGEFAIKDTQYLPGRSAYICQNSACLAKAIATKALNRAFKTCVPESIYDELTELQRKYEADSETNAYIFRLLGLARRARQSIIGQDNVKKACRSGFSGIILVSSDAMSRLRKDMTDLKKQNPELKVYFTDFLSDELGESQGLKTCKVLALPNGPMAQTIRKRIESDIKMSSNEEENC